MNELKKILLQKKIIVVGGAGLLGEKISNQMVEDGANILIADVSKERAKLTADKIYKERRIKPPVLSVSINNEESVVSMIEKAEMILGRIDGLVNTAYPRNKNYGRKFEDVAYADFCENINLHLGGYFLVSQKILEYFKKKRGGTLLNISSIYGVVAPRFDIYEGTSITMPVEYAAIKAGIIHLTKYMAKYYAGNGININCLSLGGIFDKQPDIFLKNYKKYCLNKGMLNPEDVVDTIVFLLSDSSRYINGQNIIIDDGFTL